MVDLHASVLRITVEATEAAPLLLDEYPGSSLRGALFEALLRRFCMNPSAATCTQCPLNLTCPVATLVAPLRDEGPRGRDIPRPFVLAPLLSASSEAAYVNGMATVVQPGQRYSFEVTLVGQARHLFPYVAMSLPTLEILGLGRRQAGIRGRPRMISITACDPFSGETQPLYQRGSAQVATPTLVMTPARVVARAAALSTDRLTLEFRSPTRLIAQSQLMRRPDLRTLIARLSERLDALQREYGEPVQAQPSTLAPIAAGRVGSDEPSAEPPADDPTADRSALHRRARLLDLASQAQLAQDETRWVDVASYSSRQHRATPIGGFIGRATYMGDLAALRELLVWGEILHVGKNAVKGDGLYHIKPDVRGAR